VARNLGNVLRTLPTPGPVTEWLLTSTNISTHGRYRFRSARPREPGYAETHLQVAAGSQRHFSLVKELLGSQSQPRQDYHRENAKAEEESLMRKLTMILAAAMLVLGTTAMTTVAHAQPMGASSVCQAVKNFTPFIKEAACNGRTGHCGCGAGWISSCPGSGHCCKCVPCR
jgi:hypothetical protein